MFESALTVQMPAPPAEAVRRYFDVFNANAVHLWSDGTPRQSADWMRQRPTARWLSWLMDDGRSAANGRLLGGLGANPPGRIGYQLGDEPRSIAKLRQIIVGLRRVRQADPGALTVVNFTYLAPDLTQQLDLIARTPECDVISYDHYSMRSRTVYEHLALFREAGLRAKKPYWRYMYSYNAGDIPTESDMRWDAFVGLVYGYTGHTWFLYQIPTTHGLPVLLFDRNGSWSANETRHFGVAAKINRELRHYGRAITQLTSTDVRYWARWGIKPSATSHWRKGAGSDPYLAKVDSSRADLCLGHFRDEKGENYVMVQNLNHKHGHWSARSTRATRLRLEFDFSGSTDPSLDSNNLQVLDATSGRVKLVPLRQSGNRKVLEVSLNAGDPLLFKYKTAKPFAMR
jgi:hypothetical protein